MVGKYQTTLAGDERLQVVSVRLSLPLLLVSFGLSHRLGFNKPAIDAAIGVIAARLIAPGSERSTHVWFQDVTALDDLLGADFVNLSPGSFTRRRTCFCGVGRRLKRI